MKEIKKQICKTTYEGNCPVRGIEQTSTWKHSVDVKCDKCRNNEYLEKYNRDLLGAEIISVSSAAGDITTITLKKRGEPTKIVLWIEHHDDGLSELMYNVVEKGE